MAEMPAADLSAGAKGIGGLGPMERNPAANHGFNQYDMRLLFVHRSRRADICGIRDECRKIPVCFGATQWLAEEDCQ